MHLTEEQILEALNRVSFPGFSRNIVELGMVRGIVVDDAAIRLDLAMEQVPPQTMRHNYKFSTWCKRIFIFCNKKDCSSLVKFTA